MKTTGAFWICSILCTLRQTSIRRSCIWPWILFLPKYSESLTFREYLTEQTIGRVRLFQTQRIASIHGTFYHLSTLRTPQLHRILEATACTIINIKITAIPKSVLIFLWKTSCASPDFGKPNTQLNRALVSKNQGSTCMCGCLKQGKILFCRWSWLRFTKWLVSVHLLRLCRRNLECFLKTCSMML